jgi:hypothetical protein
MRLLDSTSLVFFAPFVLAGAVLAGACSSGAPSTELPPAPAPALGPAPPWPTPAPYDFVADVQMREVFARAHLPTGMTTRVQDDVFVLAAPYGETALLADAARRTHEALAALLHDRFSGLPSRAVTVYVVDDDNSFALLCIERLGHVCPSKWLGAWFKESREVLVNQRLGPTTLVHELVHPLVEDAGLPRWLREGIASLLEQPEIHGLAIHGTTNWRVAGLRKALRSPVERELVHLDALFRMPDDLFDGDHQLAAYSAVRFACQWMDMPERDGLWRFFRAWRDGLADDPTGEKAFTAVFGKTPHEADAEWQKWVHTL